MRDDFAVFILTHGRADRVETYTTIRKAGYTGRIVLVIDDEDSQGDEYRERYGEQVVTFSKAEMVGTFDMGDNNPRRDTVLFARNACPEIAKRLGLRYWLELDDDYTAWSYTITGHMTAHRTPVHTTFDDSLDAMIQFYESSPCILTLATAQGGDFIGGLFPELGRYGLRLKRKAMNSFLCSVERPFRFVGRMNDDVNTYVLAAIRGQLMFTTTAIQLTQEATQEHGGGLTAMYLDFGTYVKSFYTTMMAPSCAVVSVIRGQQATRVHHKIRWNNAAPKILHERHAAAATLSP